MDIQDLHNQADYGPLCKGTWEDHGYPGRTNLGNVNLTCAQPDIRNMTKGQIDGVNAEWDLTFKTSPVRLHNRLAVVPAGVEYFDQQADYYGQDTNFDYDCMWHEYWNNRGFTN